MTPSPTAAEIAARKAADHRRTEAMTPPGIGKEQLTAGHRQIETADRAAIEAIAAAT